MNLMALTERAQTFNETGKARVKSPNSKFAGLQHYGSLKTVGSLPETSPFKLDENKTFPT